MKLYEVKDVVREQVGRDRLDEPIFDWCLQRGLRELEKRDNWYWMEAKQVFVIAEDNPTYALSDIKVANLKDVESLLVSDRSLTEPGWARVEGPEVLAEIQTSFNEDDTGQPAFWTYDNLNDDPTITVWPPLPDTDYRAQLNYWAWTTLPTDANSDAHEVLRRWPEALIYLATEQGIIVSTKDVEQAAYWHTMFDNPNPSVTSEYKKMRLYQQERFNRRRYRNITTSGTSTNNDKLSAKQQNWY